jgi:hypothetical protein
VTGICSIIGVEDREINKSIMLFKQDGHDTISIFCDRFDINVCPLADILVPNHIVIMTSRQIVSYTATGS